MPFGCLSTMRFAALALITCTLGFGCRSAEMSKAAQIDWRVPDAEVKAQILELIPPGTSVQQARAVMEQNGFTCDDQPGPNDEGMLLRCRLDNIEAWPVYKSVRATFRVNEDDSVALTDVKSWLTGP